MSDIDSGGGYASMGADGKFLYLPLNFTINLKELFKNSPFLKLKKKKVKTEWS